MPAKNKDKAMQLQSVYYGDCVKHLEQWRALNFELLPSARSLADLIYLDPPWNSNADYNILWDKGDNTDKGYTAQETAFTDIWKWDDGPAERVQELIKAQFLPLDYEQKDGSRLGGNCGCAVVSDGMRQW